MPKPMLFYNPDDVAEAHDAWGANCGPAALAAILHRPVMQVARYFPDFPEKPWTTPTKMTDAMMQAGIKSYGTVESWPVYGLVFIQFEGPWEKPGVPPGAAYRHTHWVAALDDGNKHDPKERWIWDVNNDNWTEFWRWEEGTLAALLKHHKRSTGWRIRRAFEVSLWG